ncbi:hypothetical protein C2G38_2205041 [Gigaspora rosea]|uniref:MD-2-related lipid-recognition domain-containing protein n=1 Tax=Gigaspora rosea TaxID=44941 RepID=A0A397UNV3_9GLOM|nr:hypothetical protein C2G38_2205041 [Gigaspora rosea]
MKNFIFASILLALLLIVNAAPFQLNKRATTFDPCDFGDFIDVNIRTDPPESGKKESYDVSGNLTQGDITKDISFLFIVYLGEEEQLGTPYFQNFTDSHKAGSPFKISASDVPTPTQLPDSYRLEVAVGDPDKTFFGCAVATVGNSSKKSKIIDFYKLI